MSVNGGTIVVRVRGEDIGLSELLQRINSQMATGQGTIRNYTSAMAQVDPAVRAAEQSLARYAQSAASVAAKSGDFAGAQRILVQAMQQLTPATTTANQVQLQLQNTINQQAAAAAKSSFSIRDLAASMYTLQAVGGLVTGVFQQVASAINVGNELEKTLVTFRALSGTQENYEKNLAAARAQQQLFGGSLQDTVEGMSSFANLSRRTGIEIEKLTNLARAMAIIDPAQGFKGAGIALKEFFSGDITSLARRFEIPRDALNNIKGIADESERFTALTQTLAQYGITMDLLTAQAGTTAVTYEKLSGSVADATAAIGQGLGQLLEPLAQVATNVFQQVASGITALTTKSEQLQSFGARIFESTKGFDEFNAKVQAINEQIGAGDPIFAAFAAKVQELTPAQYAFAQALSATGVGVQEIFSRLSQSQGAFDGLQTALQNVVLNTDLGVDATNAFGAELGATAAISANAAGFVQGLAQAVADGLPIEQAHVALLQFKQAELASVAAAQAAETDATVAASSATALFTQKLAEEAGEKAKAQIETEALKFQQEQLYNAALAAAQGMGVTAAAAAQLAAQFNITQGEALSLISTLAQLAQAKVVAETGIGNIAPGQRNQLFNVGSATEAAAYRKELEATSKAQQEYNFAVANTAGKLQIANRELASTKEGTAAYYQALQKRDLLQQQLDAEEKRKAKAAGGAPKLTPNEKINTKLLDDLDKYNNKFEDAEQKHYDKLSEIYADYAKKQDEQFRKNEVSKRRSRADFYSGLQDAPKGVDTQKFAAAYEEAFAKAQEIAQSGKAKLAADFLELRQKQIEELEKLAEDEAKIREQRKSGDISKEDEAAAIAAIEGRKKLIEDAQAEEQKQLLEAGDENQNKLQEQLDAENKAYEDQTGKIITQAERAAQAKITHAERSKIAVDAENKSLAEQENIYARIAAKNGGTVPQSARQAIEQTPTSAATTAGETKPVTVEATEPIPVSTPGEGLLIRQGADPFVVRDDALTVAVTDMSVRLETRLGNIIEAINGAKDSISNAVRAVESAVGRIKLNSPSVVQS